MMHCLVGLIYCSTINYFVSETMPFYNLLCISLPAVLKAFYKLAVLKAFDILMLSTKSLPFSKAFYNMLVVFDSHVPVGIFIVYLL